MVVSWVAWLDVTTVVPKVAQKVVSMVVGMDAW